MFWALEYLNYIYIYLKTIIFHLFPSSSVPKLFTPFFSEHIRFFPSQQQLLYYTFPMFLYILFYFFVQNINIYTLLKPLVLLNLINVIIFLSFTNILGWLSLWVIVTLTEIISFLGIILYIKKYYYKSNENIKCNNFELTNEIEYKNIQ